MGRGATSKEPRDSGLSTARPGRTPSRPRCRAESSRLDAVGDPAAGGAQDQLRIGVRSRSRRSSSSPSASRGSAWGAAGRLAERLARACRPRCPSLRPRSRRYPSPLNQPGDGGHRVSQAFRRLHFSLVAPPGRSQPCGIVEGSNSRRDRPGRARSARGPAGRRGGGRRLGVAVLRHLGHHRSGRRAAG